MARSVREALAYLNEEVRNGSRFRVGMCKRKTREAYLIPSNGSPSAADAWSRTRYRFDGEWIRGGLIWWTGGADGYGHVAVMRWRKGRITTVDYPRSGHWNKTTVAALEQAWGNITFAGTSLDIDGVVVRRHPRRARWWQHP